MEEIKWQMECILKSLDTLKGTTNALICSTNQSYQELTSKLEAGAHREGYGSWRNSLSSIPR